MLKKRHFLVVGLLAAVAAATPAFLSREGQIVLDDQGWALASNNELDGTMEVLTDGDSHPPIYQVNVLRPGENLHLEKSVPPGVLEASKPLWLRFRARAGAPRKLRTALQDPQNSTWTSEVKLTPDWQEFRLPILPDQPTSGPATLAFQVGGESGEVAITDIKMERS